MEPQGLDWTCSVCSLTWVVNSTSTSNAGRLECAAVIGVPSCVNPTYGAMSADCMINAFATFGLLARQAWVTFDQAYALARVGTGQINPVGMYHYMALRGVDGPNLWVANSAQGYRGIHNTLTRDQFNALGPVQVIYLPPLQGQ